MFTLRALCVCLCVYIIVHLKEYPVLTKCVCITIQAYKSVYIVLLFVHMSPMYESLSTYECFPTLYTIFIVKLQLQLHIQNWQRLTFASHEPNFLFHFIVKILDGTCLLDLGNGIFLYNIRIYFGYVFKISIICTVIVSPNCAILYRTGGQY